MSGDAPRGGEWHWLWEAYVVGLCVAAMIAVILLNHRFPGDVPVSRRRAGRHRGKRAGIGPSATRLPEGDWRTFAVRRRRGGVLGARDLGVSGGRGCGTGDLPARVLDVAAAAPLSW